MGNQTSNIQQLNTMKQDIITLFPQADRDGDGYLNQEEFAIFLKSYLALWGHIIPNDDKMKSLFESNDQDNDGKLSRTDIEEMLLPDGHNVSYDPNNPQAPLPAALVNPFAKMDAAFGPPTLPIGGQPGQNQAFGGFPNPNMNQPYPPTGQGNTFVFNLGPQNQQGQNPNANPNVNPGTNPYANPFGFNFGAPQNLQGQNPNVNPNANPFGFPGGFGGFPTNANQNVQNNQGNNQGQNAPGSGQPGQPGQPLQNIFSQLIGGLGNAFQGLNMNSPQPGTSSATQPQVPNTNNLLSGLNSTLNGLVSMAGSMAFNQADLDKDGFLSVDELATLMNDKATMHGLPTYTTDQIQSQMDKYDLDKDGKLNLQEYLEMVKKGSNFFLNKPMNDLGLGGGLNQTGANLFSNQPAVPEDVED